MTSAPGKAPRADSQAPTGTPARILALDYGRARIGAAIAELGDSDARPLTTLARVNRNEDMRRLRELIREYGVRQIIVGLPLRLDGTKGDMAEEATRFAQRVHKQMGLPVELIDERLTSWEAERRLEEHQGRALRSPQAKKPRTERPDVDAMAAALILKEFLDRQNGDSQGKSESAVPASRG